MKNCCEKASQEIGFKKIEEILLSCKEVVRTDNEEFWTSYKGRVSYRGKDYGMGFIVEKGEEKITRISFWELNKESGSVSEQKSVSSQEVSLSKNINKYLLGLIEEANKLGDSQRVKLVANDTV